MVSKIFARWFGEIGEDIDELIDRVTVLDDDADVPRVSTTFSYLPRHLAIDLDRLNDRITALEND